MGCEILSIAAYLLGKHGAPLAKRADISKHTIRRHLVKLVSLWARRPWSPFTDQAGYEMARSS